jgi:fumarate reductase subunit D
VTTHKTSEPFWWGLFSAGGVVAAFLVPIHLLLHGIAIPLGWLPADVTGYERMRALFGHPLIKIYLFVLIALPLYHWAHRFRFTLYDLGLKSLRTPIAILCYGGAVIGTLATVWILLLV